MTSNEIKNIRKQLKKSQTEFGKMLGVSMRAVQTWESGDRNMPESTQIALKSILSNSDTKNQAVVSFKPKKGRPFYDIDFTLGFEQLDNDVELHPEFNIDFAPANRDTITWFRGKGNSMLGEINSGDYIALEEITNFDWFPLGRVYGIITKNGFRTIKRIVKSELQDHYLLKASNPDKISHPDQDIPKDMICKLFKVMYVIKDLDE